MSLWVGVDCGVPGIADLGGLGASGHRYCYTSAKALTTQRKQLKYKNLIVKMKDNIHEARMQVQNIGIIWGTKEY